MLWLAHSCIAMKKMFAVRELVLICCCHKKTDGLGPVSLFHMVIKANVSPLSCKSCCWYSLRDELQLNLKGAVDLDQTSSSAQTV